MPAHRQCFTVSGKATILQIIMEKASAEIAAVFNFYRSSVSSITNTDFWKSFFSTAIDNYANENEDSMRFGSVFNVYNLSEETGNGYLKTYKVPFQMTTSQLKNYSEQLFDWIIILSILRAYNVSELLLLRSIQIKYFPSLPSPLNGRKEAKKLENEIKNALPKFDTNNNRHLIEFIKAKSDKFKKFSAHPVRVDLKTTWTEFFEFISILRNVIAHQGSIVNNDTLNTIKSTAKDIFERYFETFEDEDGFVILNVKKGAAYSNFIGLLNDFSLNAAKFILDENDLSFLDMN